VIKIIGALLGSVFRIFPILLKADKHSVGNFVFCNEKKIILGLISALFFSILTNFFTIIKQMLKIILLQFYLFA